MENLQFSETIKMLCKRRGQTITSVLQDCKLPKSFIYDIEKRGAVPSANVLERIADYFDCSVDYLLGRTDKPEVNR